jgi:hypothetical protein
MNMKFLTYAAVLLVLCRNVWAEAPYPYEGFAEEPPYILKIHGCDLKNMTAGHRVVPIQRESSSSALILPPSRYWEIKGSVNQEIRRAKESSTELKKAWKKVSEFEEVGNILAMEHWEKKAFSIELEITRSTNRKFLPQYAQRIISTENLPTYFGRLHTDRFKTRTLEELIEETGDNCIKEMN